MSDIQRDYSVVLWRRISEAQSAEKANRLSRSHWNSIVFNITALTERQSQGMWDFLCWWWEQWGNSSSISCGSWRYCPEYCTLRVKLLSAYLVCILFLYSVVKDSRQNIVTDQSSSWAGEALNLFLNSQFGSSWCVDFWGQRRQLNWGKPVCLFPLLVNFPWFFLF